MIDFFSCSCYCAIVVLEALNLHFERFGGSEIVSADISKLWLIIPSNWGICSQDSGVDTDLKHSDANLEVYWRGAKWFRVFWEQVLWKQLKIPTKP